MTTNKEVWRFQEWQASLTPRGSSGRGRSTESEDAEESADAQSLEAVREQQTEFIEAMNGGAEAFASYIRAAIWLQEDRLEDTQELPRPLTAGEVFAPPLELERELYASWAGRLTPKQASQPFYWTRCHIRWLEEGKLVDDPDASFSTGVAGRKKQPGPNSSQIQINDVRTRDALRHIGGLKLVRGPVSVLADCPMSRAWWRRRLAEQAASIYPVMSADEAHRALTNAVWNRLAELSMRQVTIINQPQVRTALIAYLVQSGDAPQTQDFIQSAARQLAQYGLRYSLAHLSCDELIGLLRS